MIDGIRPPRRPQMSPAQQVSATSPRIGPPTPTPMISPSQLQPRLESQATHTPVPPHAPETPVPTPAEPRRASHMVRNIILSLVGLMILIGVGASLWYTHQLSPVKSGDSTRTRILIASGMSPRQIAAELQSKGLIRDANVFEMYARLTGSHGKLQAGQYSLSAGESTPQIIDHLKAGKTDTIQITFYPGATLRDTWSPEAKRSDVTTMLVRAGYPEAEVTTALAATYSHPLFAGKPAGSSLEGYVFGETYTVDTGASVEDVLRMTFDEYWKYIQANRLVDAFASHGLTLYQGITLASIVQREVSNPADQGQVAQVFYTRLSTDTVLGSDVTFIYAAHQLGVTPTVDLKSPYNTRQVKGLPPGPIASPGAGALQAVAHPASGSYVYFVAGEDGKTYFAYTEQEHNQNIRDHCGSLCQ